MFNSQTAWVEGSVHIWAAPVQMSYGESWETAVNVQASGQNRGSCCDSPISWSGFVSQALGRPEGRSTFSYGSPGWWDAAQQDTAGGVKLRWLTGQQAKMQQNIMHKVAGSPGLESVKSTIVFQTLLFPLKMKTGSCDRTPVNKLSTQSLSFLILWRSHLFLFLVTNQWIHIISDEWLLLWAAAGLACFISRKCWRLSAKGNWCTYIHTYILHACQKLNVFTDCNLWSCTSTEVREYERVKPHQGCGDICLCNSWMYSDSTE